MIHHDHHHAAERLQLQTLADRFGLELEIPRVVCSFPGGPVCDDCAMAPITRLPVGETVLTCHPSTLDSGVSSPNLVEDAQLHWEGAPADHGIIAFSGVLAVFWFYKNTETSRILLFWGLALFGVRCSWSACLFRGIEWCWRV